MSAEPDDFEQRILGLIRCPSCQGTGRGDDYGEQDYCSLCGGFGFNRKTKIGNFLEDTVEAMIIYHLRNQE